MSRIREIRTKLADAERERDTIIDQALDQDREVTTSEAKKLRAYDSKAKLLDEEIDREIAKGDRDEARSAPRARQTRPIIPMGQPDQLGGLPGDYAHAHAYGHAAGDPFTAHLPDAVCGGGGFGNVGEMLAAIAQQASGSGADSRLAQLDVQRISAISEGSSSGGGFFIPTQHASGLLASSTIQQATLLDNSMVVPMGRESMQCPGWSDDSHATSPYGIEWGVVAEDAEFPEQDLTSNAVLMVAHKHGALFYTSNEWLADVDRGGDAKIQQIMSASLRWHIENLLWTGNGVANPIGVTAADGTLTIDAEVTQAPKTIVYENLQNMYARMLPGSHDRAIWVANQTVLPQLLNMTITAGAASTAIPIVQPYAGAGVAGAPAQAIFGRPLYISEHLQPLGTAGDFVFIDPSKYLFGDRRMVTVDVDRSYRFKNDQTAFRVSARFAGAPAMAGTFQPANSADTCGYAVQIAERA